MRIRGTTNKDELRPAPEGLNPSRTLQLQNRDAHIARLLHTAPSQSAFNEVSQSQDRSKNLPLRPSRIQPQMSVYEYDERNRLAEEQDDGV